MEHGERHKWQLTIQNNNGIPPGTIVSSHGIRSYYTVPAPGGMPHIDHQAAKGEQHTQKLKSDQRAENRDQANEPFKDSNLQDVETQDDGHEPIEEYFKEPYKHRRSPTYYSRISSREITPPTISQRPPVHPNSLQGFPAIHKSFGDRSVVDEDFYNALSRHQSDPDLRTADRRKRSIDPPHTSGDGRGATPQPVMRHGGRQTRSLPELNHASAVINQKQGVSTQTSTMQGIQLPTLPATTQLITQHQVSHPVKTLLIKQQSSPRPLYLIQNDHKSDSDDSDSDTSKHYYYGPNNERLPGPPQQDVQSSYQSNNTRLPYLLPPIKPSQSMPTTSHRHRRFRMHTNLEYGHVVDDIKADKLPESVHRELLKEYGHLAKTEVVIVKRNGNYNIHTRPQRRATSDGFNLKQSQYSDDEMDDGDEEVGHRSMRTY